jgi:fusion and transport protein UGO1
VFHERKDIDQSGYLVRSDVYDDDSRPAFQLAPIEGGVWKTVTNLVKHPTEGWFSLWKGTWLQMDTVIVRQPILRRQYG